MRTGKPLTLLLLGIASIAWQGPSRAEIYKIVDAEGNVTFTDRYRPGAIRMSGEYAAARGRITASTRRSSPASSTPSPANFPKVAPETQRQRDDLRRQILLDERGRESGLLAEAQAAFTAGSRKPGADLGKLSETVRRHEQNIVMLDKELSRFK